MESDYPADQAVYANASVQQLYAKQAAETQLRAGGGGLAGNAVAPPMPSFFDQVSQRIQALGNILGETNQELSMLGDRVFGGSPQTGASGPKTAPHGAGHAGSVLESFDLILHAAHDIAQRARALNSRL